MHRGLELADVIVLLKDVLSHTSANMRAHTAASALRSFSFLTRSLEIVSDCGLLILMVVLLVLPWMSRAGLLAKAVLTKPLGP